MPPVLLTKAARRLRSQQGFVEDIVWQALRNRKLGGWKWKRQAPRDRFIADFLCSEAKLVLEIDGGIHRLEDKLERDATRTRRLESLGLKVLRFTNAEVLADRERVFATILATCGKAPSPRPSPRGERENRTHYPTESEIACSSSVMSAGTSANRGVER